MPIFDCDIADYADPNWAEHDAKLKHVHEWKSYIGEELRGMWGTFSDGQKKAIAANAQDIADREQWD